VPMIYKQCRRHRVQHVHETATSMNAEQYYTHSNLQHLCLDLDQILNNFGGLNFWNVPDKKASSVAYGRHRIGEGTYQCLLELHQLIHADHEMQETKPTAIPYEFHYIEDVLCEIQCSIDFVDQTTKGATPHSCDKVLLANLAKHYKTYLSMRIRDKNYAAHKELADLVENEASLGTQSYRLFQKCVNEGYQAVSNHDGSGGVNMAHF